jgi:hypothetical protein
MFKNNFDRHLFNPLFTHVAIKDTMYHDRVIILLWLSKELLLVGVWFNITIIFLAHKG